MTFDHRTRAAEQNAPPTLSSIAYGSQVPVERRSRSGWIASVAAVIVGSTTGGALALRGDPDRSLAPHPTSPQQPSPARTSPDAMRSSPPSGLSPTPGTAVGATPGSASAPLGPAPPDLHVAVVAQIKAAGMRFVLWSHEHPGAQCPDAAAFGAAAADPWGRSLRVLCADQPDDQVVGVLSLGPDGLPGTPDDVASWTLGPDVTDLLRGTPWGSGWGVSAGTGAKRAGRPALHGIGPRSPSTATPPAMLPPAATPPAATPPAATPPAATPRTKPSARTGAGSNDTDGDGIPDRR